VAEPVIAFVGAVLPAGRAWPEQFNQALAMFQRFTLSGLSQCGFTIDRIFSMLPLVHFPEQRDLLVPFERTVSDDGFTLTQVPYVNLPALKQLTAALTLFPALALWAFRNRRRERAILLHNLHPAPGIVCWAAARLTGTPIVAVIADVHVPGAGARERGFLNTLDFRLQTATIPRLDGIVALTRHIRDDFAPGVPALLMEGAVSEDARAQPFEELQLRDGKVTFMYAGSLSATKGTALLLDAFRLLEGDRYRLWITGEGPMRGAVEEAAAADPRIRYWGFVPYGEAMRLYRQATIFVNPHASTVRSARYQFPSKILEYLAVGRPVISSVTPEIESEYGDIVILVQEESAEALAEAMQRAAAMPEVELAALGRKGRDFVLREKTWERQSARIAQFIREICSRRSAAGRSV
jgi:glycosyltransferase involved in cell wall biosynthesis